jgi:uncharacterized circularly permuted ATP-grasp superfamily protein/uncharacterized alpha-E superfamily protein
MSIAAPAAILPPHGFAGGYAAQPSGFDEMLDRDGSLRPHWRMFVSMLDDLGRDELTRRWEQARRLIHENGITHNVYGDPQGLDRPWSLDFIPLLLPADQWRRIDSALVQRARLLDSLLADLYGPNRCIAGGYVPAELLYANPGFLRSCHGIIPPRGHRLHVYAADIVRTTDGQFQVLSDRTQSPSGAGYTLENRIVLSRALPAIFRQCNVERLAPFFVALRQTLSELAPSNRENPRVVLLTPGPYNETYFEHAYLARYLGYTLVQGNDLTVRDARVFLKTLGGLQRVDVILRRVDDDFCDPLEFLSRSFLGVPGLVEAVREGNVSVANALGSGVLQAPAFLPFLQGLCRFLLGEELRLPSVQTWWCGQPDALRYVLDHLAQLVIKPAFPTTNSNPIFGRQLSKAELAEWAGKISANPMNWVGQEHVVSCTAPVLQNEEAQSRRFVVRAYLAATNGSYTVMPGGLTRITNSTDSLVVSLQKGGGSKDTWILADGPVSEVSLLAPASQPIELSRGGGDLPSRVADDLYWLGRYVQRAESIVRLTRCALTRLMDPSGLESERTVEALIIALIGKSKLKVGPRTEHELIKAVFAPLRQEGLRPTVNHVHNLARVLRDRISADAWRILQTIERDVSTFSGDVDDDHVTSVIELLDKLVLSFAGFIGLAMDSMTRGQSWRFLDMGHRIERAVKLCHLIQTTLVDAAPEDSSLLEAVLDAADSSLTYRRRYVTHFEVAAVVDLLVADETNPRAIAFQIGAIAEHLANLPRESTHPHRNPDRQMTLRLRTELILTDLGAACEPLEGTRPQLDGLLTEVREDLTAISEQLSQIYFSHAKSSRRFITGNTEATS